MRAAFKIRSIYQSKKLFGDKVSAPSQHVTSPQVIFCSYLAIKELHDPQGTANSAPFEGVFRD